MVILDNSRTLEAFERQSRILHITNKLITNLINYLPEYPWYEYILQFKRPIRRKLTRANKCWQSLYQYLY